MIVKKRAKAQRSHQQGRTPFWVRGMPQRNPMIEEKAMMIFQPDVLIDAQFQSTQRSRFYLDPERVLMLAVLQDAVVCFQEHILAKCKRKQSLHREAEECEMLGLDASYMRQGLLRWKRTVRTNDSETLRQIVGRVGT